MADASTPQPIFLEDYRVPDYLIDEVDLDLRLDPAATLVVTRLKVRRNPAAGAGTPPLVLDGEELELVTVRLDGEALGPNRYSVDDEHLTIEAPPAAFTLEVTSKTRPEANTKLEGLYLSNGIYCSQCESEGFRRIAYYPDRPDVMATYRTRIEADRAACPVLLSNGNLVESGELAGGRHFAVWHDPFPKPTYLFALVAGDLARLEDHFTTRSGRDVLLEIYAEAKDIDKCDHAMVSLKKSMKWDEDRFGLEYDLDRFMIVAVSDFNYGAMENKGLNIFNTKYVLAKPETATDSDYLGIESVVAHEYFHNWTGDRVTCRDWFQLSLKEGLTVFRDQEFSSDLHSRAVKRISDVRRLRASQFIEDGGPLAHPIRPESYVEIGNFYTATVYEKGAEVIRMLHTLIGEDAFQRGMRIYFERHDGQAVTCEDFVAAMEAGSGRDLGKFRLWYSQAGTPKLTVRGRYDAAARTYTMDVRQEVPDTPGQTSKQPMPIPLAMGLLDPSGAPLPLHLEGEAQATSGTRVLEIDQAEQRFTFEDVPAEPVASLLRGFSAPVSLDADQDDDQLRFLMANDSDPFVRWEAGHSYATKVMLELVAARAAGPPLALDRGLADAFAATLADTRLERAFLAQALALPAESFVGEQMAVIDVDGIHAARKFLRQALGATLHQEWRATYERYQTAAYSIEAEAIGARALKNLALGYRIAGGSAAGACVEQFARATNMTDQIAALALLAESDLPERADALATFYDRWQDDALVVDKWFALQAQTQRADSLDQVTALIGHEAFTLKNPNRARALVGGFAANPTGFHRADGAGYAFVADQLLALEKLNPSVAARMTTIFGRWRRYDPARQDLMRGQLERILATPNLSRDTFEVASKSLAS